MRPISVLFVGDVVGGLGKRTLLGLLPTLRERHSPTFVVANGENIATWMIARRSFARPIFCAASPATGGAWSPVTRCGWA